MADAARLHVHDRLAGTGVGHDDVDELDVGALGRAMTPWTVCGTGSSTVGDGQRAALRAGAVESVTLAAGAPGSNAVRGKQSGTTAPWGSRDAVAGRRRAVSPRPRPGPRSRRGCRATASVSRLDVSRRLSDDGHDECGGDGSEPLAAAGETQPVGVVPLDRHRRAHGIREPASASARRRTDLRPVADDLHGDVADLEPRLSHEAGRLGEQGAPDAPASSGRPVPKCAPRSPMPAAQNRASQAAWAATSASEWPSSPRSPGQCRPASHSSRPAIGCRQGVDVDPDPDPRQRQHSSSISRPWARTTGCRGSVDSVERLGQRAL